MKVVAKRSLAGVCAVAVAAMVGSSPAWARAGTPGPEARAPGRETRAEAPGPEAREAGTAPAESPEARVHEALRVEAEPGLEDAARFPSWVVERSGAAVESLAAGTGRAQWVRVEIGGETYDYRVKVTPMRDGEGVGGAVEAVVCECTSKELLDRIDAEVRRAVAVLEETPVAERGEPSPVSVPVEGEPRPVPDDEPGLTWRGKTGAGLIAVGGAGVIAGVVMVAVDRGPPLSGLSYAQRDWRNPTGYVVLGVGGAMLAGGVVLLVLDLTRCKRDPGRCGAGKEDVGPQAGRRERQARARVRWAPWAGFGEAGVSVSGRF
jgi:hypothetical protein